MPTRHEEEHVAGTKDPDDDFFRNFDGPYAGFDYIRIGGGGHNIACNPSLHHKVFLEDSGEDYRQWFKPTSSKELPGSGRWDIPAEYHDTSWVAKETIDFITKQKNDNPDQGWYCMANFRDPHTPFVCPEPICKIVLQLALPDKAFSNSLTPFASSRSRKRGRGTRFTVCRLWICQQPQP